MKPYFEDRKSGIVIYHADCYEILPQITWAGLLLTDPQYGIGYRTKNNRSIGVGLKWDPRTVKAWREPDWKPLKDGDQRPFDPTPFLAYPEVILWGANNYCQLLPSSRGWLIWDKLRDKTPCDNGDCELAWTNFDMPIRVWRQLWRGIVREGEENVANGGKLHPCQKPVALMSWCIQFSKSKAPILDPFMGSGTTLDAAKRLGRPAVGIDIEESHCETAAKRLSQDFLQLA